MDGYAEMDAVLAPLWAIQAPQPDNIFQHPAFKAVEDFCRSRHPGAMRGLYTPFALWHGLCLLGVPCAQPPGFLPGDRADAARGMVDGLDKKTAIRRYIAPLDLAGRIPPLRFGNAEVRRFSADDLRILFEESTIRRLHADPVDLHRFAEFHWLVVEDPVAISKTISARLNQFDFSRDMGAIAPHAGRFPEPLMSALFALLVQPWEEWHSYGEMNWRPFVVPWVHVVTGDIFERPDPIPSADSLTWEPAADHEGNEYERPVAIHLDTRADDHLATLDETFWNRLNMARESVLFETPVEHFVLRAFFSDGMDEIIAHMTAIEAAVGLKSDYERPGRKGSAPLPARKRVMKRISELLKDTAAGDDYDRLFEMRSEFVHGRKIEGTVPSTTRNLARTLARRIVVALVGKAPTLPKETTREHFLSELA